MRIRTLLKEQGTPGWDSLDYLVYQSWAENAPSITITNWNQSTCYANTNASSSSLIHKDQDIPLKLETVLIQLWAYWYTSSVVLTDNLGVEHPFSFYSLTSDSKTYTVRASDYGAEYFNKVQLSASGSNGKAISVRANQLGWKEPEPDWGSDYDAEIEYLESTGTQYINTKYNPNNRTVLDVAFSLDNQKGQTVCAARWTGASTYDTFGIYRASASDIVYYGRFSSNRYLSVNFINGINTVKMGINSVVLNGNSYSITRDSFTSTYPLYLFSFNNMGATIEAFIGKIYSFSISENDIKILDMIPVRVGNVGYLYDKVSGQLFGNKGTGSFILGPDK